MNSADHGRQSTLEHAGPLAARSGRGAQWRPTSESNARFRTLIPGVTSDARRRPNRYHAATLADVPPPSGPAFARRGAGASAVRRRLPAGRGGGRLRGRRRGRLRGWRRGRCRERHGQRVHRGGGRFSRRVAVRGRRRARDGHRGHGRFDGRVRVARRHRDPRGRGQRGGRGGRHGAGARGREPGGRQPGRGRVHDDPSRRRHRLRAGPPGEGAARRHPRHVPRRGRERDRPLRAGTPRGGRARDRLRPVGGAPALRGARVDRRGAAIHRPRARVRGYDAARVHARRGAGGDPRLPAQRAHLPPRRRRPRHRRHVRAAGSRRGPHAPPRPGARRLLPRRDGRP